MYGVIPSLRVADLEAAVEFYVDALGFEVVRGTPAEGNVAVSLGDARIMLETVADFYDPAYNDEIRARLGGAAPHSLYVEAPDLAAYYDRLRDRGVKVVDPLADRPWGQAEFTVEDHAGNWLSFYAAHGSGA